MGSPAGFEQRVIGALVDSPTNWVVAVAGPQGPPLSVGDPHASFPLASVTKPLSAAALWLAVEEGTVNWDDHVGPPGSTLAHLLAHASGLPLEGHTPVAAVGTRRIYSNTGFELAAEHLAAASGLTLATYLHEGICESLAMTSTRLTASPAWGATSTAADLIRFGQELLGPSVLTRATIDHVTRVAFGHLDGVLPGYGRQTPNPWGLGIEVRGDKAPHWTGSNNSHHTFGHFGRSGTFIWVDPIARRTAVFLGDRDFGPWAIEAWPTISDAALDLELPG
ncbi:MULTISPECIES: serine hydrolase domain-containing protein [Candidatus Microthrix]|jgi:CubicO group peptidase (beta-lactamase class C family)|uniref:serine hydrolase domain-containing protein n=1 Tax=Candidatus Neomicrothrix TaxID=41949 RepID=UPI00036DCEA2|nr:MULTISPECIES: serine hydrolase domain-containing protein [Microthrix]MBL0204023.1 beta-lactamase family protein [Candidatus Microthrix sp.]MBP6135341.1 beta-lactamase family protein [Candidatus Microthrix sp.]MBP6149696.1 beta-lactamase family protein [Candidatus Microthrix sp.]MBP7405096.1 beta-lactamase family protein [Candidatus Microthrix sp.]MBP7853603.1 beta-lactamase family protein [Candidatus Microthrix sp.]